MKKLLTFLLDLLWGVSFVALFIAPIGAVETLSNLIEGFGNPPPSIREVLIWWAITVLAVVVLFVHHPQPKE